MSKQAKRKEFSPMPPRWADRFLEFYCSDELIDEIQGDLHEAYRERYRLKRPMIAKLWFVLDVLRFFRPSSFRKQQRGQSRALCKVYILPGLRNFKKDKLYASINLLGLTVGISTCLFVVLYIQNELSYDQFHPQADRIYRVPMDMYNAGELKTRSATVFGGVGPALKADFPEVVSYVTVSPFASGTFANTQKHSIRQDKAIWASANFFEMFGYPLLEGDRKSILEAPNSVVISQKVADQYFPGTNPVGQVLKRNGDTEFVVTAVMSNTALRSHMEYDLVMNIRDFDDYGEALEDWGWSDFYCYIKLGDQVDVEALQAKLPGYLGKYKQAVFDRYNLNQELWLQEVTDIHLKSDLTWEMAPNGSISEVYFLGVIGLLILTVAWVNFVNLATARAARRTKEIHVRKILGAAKKQLMLQVITESLLFNLMAILIGISVVYLAVERVNLWLGLELDRDWLLQLEIVLSLLALAATGALLSGLYPALVITRFDAQPAKRKKNTWRKVLVAGQLVVSVLLILGTLMVIKQLDFMRNQSLGMETDQVLVIRGGDSNDLEDLAEKSEVLKTSMSTIPGVLNIAGANVVPGVENTRLTSFASDYAKDPKACNYSMVSQGYFESLGVGLISGRYFSKDLKSDNKSLILNESAAKVLGFASAEEALGQVINRGKWSERKVVGVVNDYHQQSLKEQIDPMVFFYDSQGDETSYVFLKLASSELRNTMETLEASWMSVFPESPFDYFFLDEFFDRQYKSDKQFNLIFTVFAGLAVFVACLGLFGLVSFAAEQNKKAIGIRKVLGASVTRVMLLLAKDYAKLLLVAFIFAFPAGYFIIKQWLQGFAYQATIGLEIFILGGTFIGLIALMTVSLKSFKVANCNPVDVLRDE